MKKEEYNEWYESVMFLEKEFRIYKYIDFCEECKTYKKFYKTLDTKVKKVLRMYIYANPNIMPRHKKAIWEYLNGDMGDADLQKYL